VKFTEISNFTKIQPMGAELFQADLQTETRPTWRCQYALNIAQYGEDSLSADIVTQL